MTRPGLTLRAAGVTKLYRFSAASAASLVHRRSSFLKLLMALISKLAADGRLWLQTHQLIDSFANGARQHTYLVRAIVCCPKCILQLRVAQLRKPTTDPFSIGNRDVT